VARRQVRGVTLVDALVLIVLVGVLAGGNTLLMSRLADAAATTARELELLQLASGLMAEVAAMPMTFCDADDANVATAQAAAILATGCATLVDALGPEAGESRFGPQRFDHVSDWVGYAMPGPGCAGLCDASGTLLVGGALTGCSARVSVVPQAWAGIAAIDAQGQAQVLQVRVTVDCPGRAAIVLESVRVRDAPNRT
jgi:MSHA pilin protein MshD